jgi:hypothetical protein
VFDAGYDSAQLTLDLVQERAAVLVRLRSDRCLDADPPPPPPGRIGRPRRHGAKFNCADPATWPAPTATLATSDDQYGTVTVRAWAGLHPKQHNHPGKGTRAPRPIVRGTVVRVQVQRVPARTRPPKVLWLWWAGPGAADLDLAWRAYTRRFDLEHTVRFAKHNLGWTTPRPRHPEQGRPVDLADPGRLRPAAPGPRGRGRPAAGVGAAPPARPAVALPGPPGVSAAVVRIGIARQRPETLRTLPRPAQGPPQRPRHSPSRDQEGRLTSNHQHKHRCRPSSDNPTRPPG